MTSAHPKLKSASRTLDSKSGASPIGLASSAGARGRGSAAGSSPPFPGPLYMLLSPIRL